MWTGLTPEDVAAHYMAWMALGGTKANIPVDIISLVGTTTVVGLRRAIALTGSANMLSNAKQICLSILGPSQQDLAPEANGFFDMRPGHAYFDFYNSHLIRKNGDAELWMRLCTLNNHPFVHAIEPAAGTAQPQILGNGGNGLVDGASAYLIPWGTYSGPVGDEHGGVDPALSEANEWPWCVDATTFPNACSATHPPPNCVPLCPSGATLPSSPHPTDEDTQQWAVRGAINAAFSVFVYLEALERQTVPEADYNDCEALQTSVDGGSP
jgi:hypothetical protein